MNIRADRLEAALNAHKQKNLQEWLIDYLMGEDNNRKLAGHISDHPDATMNLF